MVRRAVGLIADQGGGARLVGDLRDFLYYISVIFVCLLIAQTTLDNLDRNVTDPNAPVQRNLEDTLVELQRTARVPVFVGADYERDGQWVRFKRVYLGT